jgi:hypothetical protein
MVKSSADVELSLVVAAEMNLVADAHEVTRGARPGDLEPHVTVPVLRHKYLTWLIGNGHVLANSFLVVCESQGEYRVSSVYDPYSTRACGDPTVALPIAGPREGLTGRTSLRSLTRFAERAAAMVMDELVDSTSHLGEDPRVRELPVDSSTVATWVRRLEYRRRQFTR